MDSVDSRLFRQLTEKIEEARKDNKDRVVSQYNPGLNYYHAGVAREIALTDMLSWMEDLKKEMNTV